MKNNEAGVTLVELLVAIALAGIVSTVIYTAYQVQMKVYQDEDDVVQITGRGGIILINKAEVTAENPVEVLQADFQKEKEDAEKERDQIKNRIKQLLSEGKSLDEVLDEVLRFLF